jgi:hypothetical protein
MTKDEALKLALEALEGLKSIPGGRHELHELNAIHRKHERAITAIKQALAVPVQEPVAWMWRCKPYCDWPNWAVSLKRPADSGRDGHKRTEGYEDIPLYTTPPASQPAQKRPQNCGTGYCSCIECVMEQKPVKWSDHEPDGMHHKQEKNT